ncbi:MAG: hypothetical protein HLX46_02590 [Corynebacterium sp.]|uniref:hypothetical protein n=1 Tax=Corynebacterium sp. TaxID=1720 RepID=UPI0017DD5F82|nr:hypothetical protein [Corynebacterium sp.]NWO15738.1 hypothetical protein [Corynebacterium sp.]
MSELQKFDTEIALPQVSDDGIADLMKQAEAMSAAHKLATVLCNTAMVPATFRGKPDDAAAAILYGAEVGLKPQQALQQVFVVHGQPAIYARTMAALLKAKGYKFSTVESTDESVTVEGVSPRGEHESSTWTIQRAKTAGYTSNKKYQTDPQAMLYAKAISEVARKLAPDVLLGIKYTAEDLELEPVKATATRMDVQRGAEGVRAALAAKKEQTEPESSQDDSADYVREVTDHLATLDTQEQVNEFMASLQAQDANLPEGVLAAGRARWEEINA